MKKISLGVFALIAIFFLVACEKKITTEDLKANDWIAESSSEDEPNMLLSFSEHVMSVSIDTDSMTSSAKDEWEQLGEDIAKQLIDQMSYKLEYVLDKDSIKIQDTDDEDAYVYYTVSKEDDNIVFTPDEKKNKDDSDAEKLVLKPYTKKKEVESSSSSTEQTTVSSESAAANLDDIIEAFSQQSLVVYNPRDMTKDDFGIAPMSATSAKIFSLVETDNEDDQRNARLLTFDNLDDLRATKQYYDDLGKDSAMLFSYTAVNEDDLVLMQFNGQLSQDLVEKYAKAASMELTESPFASNSTESEAYSSESVAAYSEESTQPVEVPASSEETVPESSVQTQPVEDYTTVQKGEGPPDIAARVGISVEELYELNGMDPNNFMLYPGDTLRVK
ncbi:MULTISPECIES: LysM domain-containing protein [unclassified Enterococcus]|uniref:LysM peptidoglycan-binding domain-containing protein n=1 Tax=unclassified Enterococcus TaxID=2608891 RepID=UPI00259B82E5|nr:MULTISPECIES: LysM domain-containing protein [unclassified Enterococcus]MDO0920420.1 LysM domain-containing protein [Enterococcus sp. B1E2]WIV16991.1 LysM domain-containing protein [Enterococcus sp. FZMF]